MEGPQSHGSPPMKDLNLRRKVKDLNLRRKVKDTCEGFKLVVPLSAEVLAWMIGILFDNVKDFPPLKSN